MGTNEGKPSLDIDDSMDVPIHYGPLPGGPGSTIHDNAHGRAALLLVESLMHCLVEKGTISREDFIEIIECAAEVELDLKLAGKDPSSAPEIRDSILDPLANTFRKELGR